MSTTASPKQTQNDNYNNLSLSQRSNEEVSSPACFSNHLPYMEHGSQQRTPLPSSPWRTSWLAVMLNLCVCVCEPVCVSLCVAFQMDQLARWRLGSWERSRKSRHTHIFCTFSYEKCATWSIAEIQWMFRCPGQLVDNQTFCVCVPATYI